MNPHVVRATLRERLAHPVRLAAFLGLFLLPLPIALLDDRTGSSLDFFHPLLAVAFGGGVVGLELSSGTLALALTRPVRRRTYLLSKWGAVAGFSAAASVLQLLAVAGILAMRHDVPPLAPHELPLRLLERLLAAGGTSAVVILFSAAGSGLTDLAVWSIASIAAQTLRSVGRLAQIPFWSTFGEQAQFVLAPGVNLWEPTRDGPPWLPLLAAMAMSAAALTLASYVLEHREITYAEIRV